MRLLSFKLVCCIIIKKDYFTFIIVDSLNFLVMSYLFLFIFLRKLKVPRSMEKHENPKNRPRFPPTEKNVKNTVKS
jgi:hypothetical protein